MIDADSALRLHLLAASPLLTLLGGPYVYWPEIPPGPGGPTMPRKAVAFRLNGGSSSDDLPVQRPTVNFRCYGTTAYEANQVYRALHDRLIRSGNLIVVDTFNSNARVAFYNWREITPGQPLEDAATGWPFRFTVWSPTVSTLAIPAA